jgi:hypothetical protein
MPSTQPSSQPTVPVTTVEQPFLAMTLDGLTDGFSADEIADWERATSNHVSDFWDTLPFSPLFVGSVTTRFLSQNRIKSESSSVADISSRQSIFDPLEILYEQTASFGFLADELDDLLFPAEDAIFLEPFRQNSLPYVRDIINITGNMGPVFLTNIEIRPPQPTSAPTQAPAPEESGSGSRNNERRIILIVVLCVGTAVISAIVYIVYLTRKENLDVPMVRPIPLEDIGSDDGNDMYYVSNSMQSPSSTQAAPNIGQSLSFESVDSPSGRSAYSDSQVSHDMEALVEPRRLNDRSGSFPSSSLPTIDDPENFTDQRVSMGSFATSGDAADLPQSPTEGDSMLTPSMEGFNLQIEDIED